MFRKFKELEEADPNNAAEDQEDEIDQSVPSSLRGPRTRSSLKPRRLFGTPKREPTTTDEEADTDIEEHLSTPSQHRAELTATPKAPKFAPASPPTTGRATRSKNVGMSNSPGGPSDDGSSTPKARGVRGKTSPFDMWQRTRGEPSSKKREAPDVLVRGGEKRTRY